MPEAPYTTAQVVRQPPLREVAYRAVRELIVSLELPPGALIDERALLQRLRMGRTPVREALQRLAQERLVEVYPRRGMFVTDVDVRELARISEVRLVLEPEAARLAAARATAAERAAMAGLVEQLDLPAAGERELMALDELVHTTIYRAAHNDLLAGTLEQYYVLALRIWMIALDREHELRAAVDQHGAMLEAVARGEADDAARLMREHVETFEEAMRAVLVTL